MNEFINSFKNIITNPSLIKNLDSVSKFLGTKSAYIEKDLWITLVLYYLFQIDSERHLYSFKGGTSLSKAFGLINRFSEDLDIYIDKTKFGYTNEYILKDLTRSKFKSFKEDLDFETEKFIKDTFILRLVNFIKSNFSEFKLEIEREGTDVFLIYDPLFLDDYVKNEVKIEFGSRGQLEPTSGVDLSSILSYSSNLKLPNFRVNTLNPLRTLYEKTMAIHTKTSKIATNADRFSRHLYDVYMLLSNKQIKHQVFNNLDLFLKSVLFNQKIDGINTTNLTSLLNGDLKLTPDFGSANFKLFEEDYKSMRPMIYGQIPRFDIILSVLKEYEEDLNRLIRENKPKIKEMFPTIKIL